MAYCDPKRLAENNTHPLRFLLNIIVVILTILSMVHNHSLLLVENNEKEADVLKHVLETDGYNVDTAYSSWAALEKFKIRTYATVILDFALPDKKGDELAEVLKLKDPKIKIILLTGFKPAIDPDRLKVFDYIFEKPITPKKYSRL